MDSEDLLRRLRRFQIIIGTLVVVLVIATGDLVYPRLDRKIGTLASDAVEAVVIFIILYFAGRPQMRELRRAIVELDFLRNKFYSESIHDVMSGLHNRRYFDERLAGEFDRARRYGQMLGLAVFDLDHFKAVNDELGHAAGDAVIVEVGRRLTQRSRRHDVVARIGGEEFAVLLPNVSADAAKTFAEDIRRLIESQPFELPSPRGTAPRRLTVSAGVSAFKPDDEFDGALLRRADEALYEAKRSRNAVVAR